jgi:hypothetical protein
MIHGFAMDSENETSSFSTVQVNRLVLQDMRNKHNKMYRCRGVGYSWMNGLWAMGYFRYTLRGFLTAFGMTRGMGDAAV